MTVNIYLSAIADEFLTARMVAARVVTAFGYNPVWCDHPENFNDDNLADVRACIDKSIAMVQIVGTKFGQWLTKEQAEVGRISLSEYEAIYALSSEKPVYYIIASEKFARDEIDVEIDELKSLQDRYREKCVATSEHATIDTMDQLCEAVHRFLEAECNRRVALLVAVNRYENHTASSMDFEIEDAAALSKLLAGDTRTGSGDGASVESQVAIVDSPGIANHASELSRPAPICDEASWNNRQTIATRKPTFDNSRQNLESARESIVKRFDQCKRQADQLLAAFPSDVVKAFDELPRKQDNGEIIKVLESQRLELTSRLKRVVNEAIDSDSTSGILVPNFQTEPMVFTGAAGAAVGSSFGTTLLPGVGTVVGGILGCIIGGWWSHDSKNEIREAILNRSKEESVRLSEQFSSLLREIEAERLRRIEEQIALKTPVSEAAPENVEISVFSEERLQRSSQALVQVFVHAKADRDAASTEAAQRDESSTCRGRHTLAVGVAAGTVVTLHLDSSGLEIQQSIQTVTWSGKLESVSYVVKVPSDAPLGKVISTLSIFVGDLPVGYVRFTVTIEEKVRESKSTFVGDSAHRYERAFISYAHKDRSEVLKRIPMLRIHRIEFFQDLLSLEPGDEWEERIYEEIESSDLFLLFWSSAALDSDWVKREWKHALKCRSTGKDGTPDIYPVIIEGPPIPSPPEELKRFHFRDFLAYVAQFEEKSIEGLPNK